MPGHKLSVKMVELGKPKENVKIEPGINGGGIVFGHGQQVQDGDRPAPSSPVGIPQQNHYQHHNNVHSNHSNPPSPVPSSCVAPSTFPTSHKVKITPDEKPHPPPANRPPSRKNLSATTPPPGN